MSAIDRQRFAGVTPGYAYARVRRTVFGDRLGVVLFLGTLVFVALYWRVGIFINDNYTIANTLANVAEGHLYLDHGVYGPNSEVTPGMKIHDGRLYGRKYGLVVAALPFLWGFEGLRLVADLRIALAALWSLVVLALAVHLGHLVDRSRQATMAGAVLAVVAFAMNVLLATPLEPRWIPLMALQTSTMVWAGLLVVVVYRLVAHLYDRRTGLVAGVGVLVATPVGFWASIPKRHVLVTLLAMVAVYAFYRSRGTDSSTALRFRALSYASVAVGAWVSPFEALLLLVALGPIDLLTARSNAPRRLAAIGGTFALFFLPFLATNYLISGNPFLPPDLLPAYTGQEQLLTGGGTTGGTGSGTQGGPGHPFSGPLVPFLVGLVSSMADSVGGHLDRLWTRFLEPGLTIVVDDPHHVYHVVVRSGYIPEVAARDGDQAISLALLEVAPVLATLVATPIVAVRGIRVPGTVRSCVESPPGTTDLLVGTYVTLVVIANLPRTLVHAQVTVRYLLPILPGLVYLAVRLPAVRHVIDTRPRWLGFAYAASVLVGGQVLLLVLLVIDPSLGEAVQLNALLGLAAAIPLGTWGLVATATDHRAPRIGSILLGVAAGTTTVFILLSGLVYFAYAGDFALPVSQRLSEALAVF